MSRIVFNATNVCLRYAKMWYKGVSFTSDQCALVYLVDSAGTRTTTDSFSDLSGDFSLGVFYRLDCVLSVVVEVFFLKVAFYV